VLLKPLIAPDLPLSRWLVVPLTGTAVVLVILTAPRWYERWQASQRELPDFLPTEEQFVDLVSYYARGPSGQEEPANCGRFGPGDDVTRGKECAQDALAAGRWFYLIFAPYSTHDFEARDALVSSGGGIYHLHYFLDTRRAPARSAIYETVCSDPRFLEGSRVELQCGPRPSLPEFVQQTTVGKECGVHSGMSDVADATTFEQIECAVAAVREREAFHYWFSTDWGGDRGLVRGALTWQPETDAAPTLSYYVGSGRTDDQSERSLIQRTCEAPRIRVVRPTSPDLRNGGYHSSIEIDCGDTAPTR